MPDIVQLFTQQMVYWINFLSIGEVFDPVVHFEVAVAELRTQLLNLFGCTSDSFLLTLCLDNIITRLLILVKFVG